MQKLTQNKIILDLGKLNAKQSGLGEYGLKFCETISNRSKEFNEKFNLKFYFFLPKKESGIFGDNVKYINRKHIFKLFNPMIQKFDIWHSLNQFCKVKPSPFSKNSITTIHDLNFLYMENDEIIKKLILKHTKLLKRTNYHISISEFVKKDIIDNIPYKINPKVIYNGVSNLIGFKQSKHKDFDYTKPFFFHISRLATNKNPESILRVSKLIPNFDFVIAGDLHHPHSNYLIEYCKSNNLTNVKFFHYISEEEKAWFYANCKGFIFPSLHEGFGMPIIEAMYFGKPVFVSNLSCLPEITSTYGYYFTDFLEENMKNVILNGLNDFELNNRSKSVSEYAENFSWNNCIDNHIKYYNEIIQLSK